MRKRPSGANEWQQPRAAEAIPTFQACDLVYTENMHAASNLAHLRGKYGVYHSIHGSNFLMYERLFVYLDYHE